MNTDKLKETTISWNKENGAIVFRVNNFEGDSVREAKFVNKVFRTIYDFGTPEENQRQLGRGETISEIENQITLIRQTGYDTEGGAIGNVVTVNNLQTLLNSLKSK